MGDRMKRSISWLLAAFLVAGIVMGCAGGGLSGQDQQDRSVSLQQAMEVLLQEAEQDQPQEEEPEGRAARSQEEEQKKTSDQAQGGGQEKTSDRPQGGGQEKTSDRPQGEAQEQRSAKPQEEEPKGSPGQLKEGAALQEGEELEAGFVEEDGAYTSKEEVALYIHLYGHLPDNYITKREAEDLGWDSRQGNLDEVAPGMSIGGSRFGNYEEALPEKEGRHYYECDIGYEGGYRGAERLIYSDDGLIFYTEDHYKTFEQLYGMP